MEGLYRVYRQFIGVSEEVFEGFDGFGGSIEGFEEVFDGFDGF